MTSFSVNGMAEQAMAQMPHGCGVSWLAYHAEGKLQLEITIWGSGESWHWGNLDSVVGPAVCRHHVSGVLIVDEQ
jgi:hypothetical protein